jgi:hypothetical protein
VSNDRTPEHYREQAANHRAIGERETDPKIREQLRTIAKSYDELAKLRERERTYRIRSMNGQPRK